MRIILELLEYINVKSKSLLEYIHENNLISFRIYTWEQSYFHKRYHGGIKIKIYIYHGKKGKKHIRES
jgi:hypothetical protein